MFAFAARPTVPNTSWMRSFCVEFIRENKWRASRYGIEGDLVDFGIERAVPVTHLWDEILALVDDVVDDLGARRDVEYVRTILEQGTSADRQLRTYERTGSLKAVVDQLIAETIEGLDVKPIVPQSAMSS